MEEGKRAGKGTGGHVGQNLGREEEGGSGVRWGGKGRRVRVILFIYIF